MLNQPMSLDELGRQMSIPVVDLWLIDVDTQLLSSFPPALLRSHRILPFAKQGDCLRVATANPFDILVFDQLRIQTGLKIEPVLARESAILYLLRTHFPISADDS
jgi:type IV pilus assembly protein PilB